MAQTTKWLPEKAKSNDDWFYRKDDRLPAMPYMPETKKDYDAEEVEYEKYQDPNGGIWQRFRHRRKG